MRDRARLAGKAYRKRLALAATLSLLAHAFVLALQFGIPGLGLPGLQLPWTSRRAQPIELNVVLAGPARSAPPVAAAEPEPPPPPIQAAPVETAPVETASIARPSTPLRVVEPRKQARGKKKTAAKSAPAQAASRKATPASRAGARLIAQDRREAFAVPPPGLDEPGKRSARMNEMSALPLPATESVEPPAHEITPLDIPTAPVDERAAQQAQARLEEENARRAAQALEARRQAEGAAQQQRRAEQLLAQEAARRAQELEEQQLEQQKLEQQKREQEQREQEQEQRLAQEMEARRQQQEAARQAALALQQQLAQHRLQEEKARRALELEARQREERQREERQREQLRLQQEAEARRLALEQESRRRAEDAERRRQAEELAARERAQAAARQQAQAAAAQREQERAAQNGGGADIAGLPVARTGADLAGRAPELARSQDALRIAPRLPSSSGAADQVRRRSAFGRIDQDVGLMMYVESWRVKIERNGRLNYRQALVESAYTEPIVAVSVRSDGSVEEIMIERSSGRPELDAAVRRIITLNARYAAFPPELARRFDVIELRHVWSFDDRLRLRETVR